MLDNNPELLLKNEDYPKNYINMAHPDDYKLSDIPVRELIFNSYGNHNRLLLRISFKIDNKYVPITFVCDTGAPMYLYLSPKALNILNSRICQDEINNLYITIDIRDRQQKIGIHESPVNHNESNIIGLLLLNKLGLLVDNNTFELKYLHDYF